MGVVCRACLTGSGVGKNHAKKKIIKIILRKFRTKRNIARKMVYITAIDHHKSKIAVKIGLKSRVGNLGRF
jgi:hypothetical protein